MGWGRWGGLEWGTNEFSASILSAGAARGEHPVFLQRCRCRPASLRKSPTRPYACDGLRLLFLRSSSHPNLRSAASCLSSHSDTGDGVALMLAQQHASAILVVDALPLCEAHVTLRASPSRGILMCALEGRPVGKGALERYKKGEVRWWKGSNRLPAYLSSHLPLSPSSIISHAAVDTFEALNLVFVGQLRC